MKEGVPNQCIPSYGAPFELSSTPMAIHLAHPSMHLTRMWVANLLLFSLSTVILCTLVHPLLEEVCTTFKKKYTPCKMLNSTGQIWWMSVLFHTLISMYRWCLVSFLLLVDLFETDPSRFATVASMLLSSPFTVAMGYSSSKCLQDDYINGYKKQCLHLLSWIKGSKGSTSFINTDHSYCNQHCIQKSIGKLLYTSWHL